MTMMEDATRGKLSEKEFYGTSGTNYSQDGRSVSSSSQKITFTASKRMYQNCLKWASSCSRWAPCLGWTWPIAFWAYPGSKARVTVTVDKIMRRDPCRWSWPTLTRCRCWTRGATSPSPSARRRRAGCTWGCRRASGTGSTTSSPPSTRARREGSSGWKVPHTPATLITDSQDFMVRIKPGRADGQSLPFAYLSSWYAFHF